MNFRSLLLILFIFMISLFSLNAQSGQLNQVRETNFQCDIVIDIYDGFVEWGATPFPKTWGGSLTAKDETKKNTEGAVFLANKNDTNGNGVIDWSENNITSNSLGRNEIDLVKIVIKPRDQGLNLTGQVVVSKISGSNDIRFWTSPVKAPGTQISLPHTTSAANLPLTLYMEAKEPSSTVRDIVIQAAFGGRIDQVTATAVWVDIHEVYYENEDIINLDVVNAPECIRTFVNLNYSSDEDSYFGKAQWTLPQGEELYGGRILFQWKLNPTDAKDLIMMDGTRQRHTKNWKLDLKGLPGNLPDCKFTFEEEKFPFHKNMDNELPNDDRYKQYLCPDLNSITSNGHFFTYDAVNLLTNGEFLSDPKYYANSNDKTNFLEYIRVAPIGTNFNPPFSGLGKLIGSRASNKLPWSFARYTHKGQDFNLKPDNNVISLSHVRINQIPNDHTYYPINYSNELLNHNYSVGRYNAIISQGQGEENEYLQIFLTRISADEHGTCNIYDENIDIENIPNSTTVYDLPFQNHTINIQELEDFDIIFLNWHTFRSANKLNELKYGTHITNLNH